MKNILKYTCLCFCAIILLLQVSCTKNFEEINTDPNNAAVATPEQLLFPALVGVLHHNMMRNRNFTNELMQITVNVTESEGSVFRYDYRANWADYLYNELYIELTNFKDIYKKAADTSAVTYSLPHAAISLICQSWVISILTDMYGDLPFSESNLGRDTAGTLTPKFDTQKDIYLSIFNNLEAANNLLSKGGAIAAAADPVFYGDLSKWRKFGNSLYLRSLLRVSSKAEVADTCIKKIIEIVETKASTYPIISSLSESAILKWRGVSPLASPYIVIREQDFRSPRLAAFFIDNLVKWSDPRIDIPLGTAGINRWGIAPLNGSFVGVPSGYAPGTGSYNGSSFYSNTSVVSLMSDSLTGMMLNYAELQFILCEAAAKGWITKSAETYYKNGVRASIQQWMPLWNTTGPADSVLNSYLTNAEMLWDDAETREQKMQKIHLQKYYAMFLTDMQQWYEYRRTGFPILPKGSGLQNNGEMPARMFYPIYVQATNPKHYKEAIERQGPDAINTKVWWQKP